MKNIKRFIQVIATAHLLTLPAVAEIHTEEWTPENRGREFVTVRFVDQGQSVRFTVRPPRESFFSEKDKLWRESATLHLMDGAKKIASVEFGPPSIQSGGNYEFTVSRGLLEKSTFRMSAMLLGGNGGGESYTVPLIKFIKL
ncbi:MAG: hypothetical protein AB8F34_09920 [Akkermansiaceae bacterium]